MFCLLVFLPVCALFFLRCDTPGLFLLLFFLFVISSDFKPSVYLGMLLHFLYQQGNGLRLPLEMWDWIAKYRVCPCVKSTTTSLYSLVEMIRAPQVCLRGLAEAELAVLLVEDDDVRPANSHQQEEP
jgi:hypothetical protein